MTRLDAGLLTLNGTLIAQLLIFLVMLGVLYRFAWGPLLKILNERRERIQQGVEATERAKRELEEAERERQAKLEEARREAQAMLDRIAKQGEDIRKELETKAREQADALIARARAEIQQERQKAVQDLRLQVADLAVMAAGRIIGESLDAKKHRELIERAIEEAEIRA
ncbi:MAG: F-type H+-transporting ATPase subunit b [Chloroflexota bacterium]|jgi:F-type H+-transporting ATPase subunit b|nr:F-type H+-transporting ATPase subunit b [Chloroflexota bacterium]MEA2669724.1 F-type H+-transporting ATPase subunit b [Chloroflexota bacterium]